MANIGKVEGSITLRDEFSSQLEVAATKLDAFGGKAQRVGGQMQAVGRGLLPVSAGLAAAAVAGLSFSTDLSRGMANVASLIPGNTARVAELKGEVQQLAIAHGKPVQDLVGGLYQTISAFGDDAAQTTKILEINSRAATAGVAETADAINLTSSVTKAYGDTSAEAVQKVADLALATVRMGQTTFPELAASMGKVTPIAQAMGQSQEDLFAVFATATGVVGSAREVSTQYRGVLAALLNPTEDLTALIEQQGFASGQAMLEQQGLVGTLQNIVAATEESGQPITKYISQIEAVPLALALAGPQADTFRGKLDELGVSAGAVDAAFKEQTEGINEAGFKWDQAKQRLAAMAVALGDNLAPALIATLDAAEPLIDWATSAIGAFADLPAPIRAVGLALGGILIAGPPLLILLGKLVTAFGQVAGSAAGAGGATAGIKGLSVALGKGGLVLAAGAAGIAIGTLISKFADWREETDSLVGKHNLWFDMLSSDVLADWIDSVGGYGESLDGLNTSAAETARLHAEMPTAIDRMNDAASDANVQLAAMAEAGNEVGFRYTVLDGELRKVDMTTRQLIPTVAAAGDEVDDLGNSGSTAAPKISELEKALSSLGFVTGTSVTTELDALSLAVADGQTPVVQLQGKITELTERYRDLGLLTPEVEARLASLNEKAGGWGFVASEAARGTEDWRDTFVDMRPKAAAWGTVMDENVTNTLDFQLGLERANDELMEERVAMEAATKAGDGFFASFKTGIPVIDGFIGKLGGLFSGDGFLGKIGSLFGGDGEGSIMGTISGALGGISGKLSGAFDSILGSAMSGGLTAALGPLGPLLSAGISKLGGLALKGLGALGKKIAGIFKGWFGGPDATELAGRDAAASFRDAVRAELSDEVMAQVQLQFPGDVQNAAFLASIHEKLVAAGVAADEASIQAQNWGTKLFEAEKQGGDAVAAVIAQIEAATTATTQAVADTAAAATEATSTQTAEVAAAIETMAADSSKTVADQFILAIGDVDLAQRELAMSIGTAHEEAARKTVESATAVLDHWRSVMSGSADSVAEMEAAYKVALKELDVANKAWGDATTDEAREQARVMGDAARASIKEWEAALRGMEDAAGNSSSTITEAFRRTGDSISDTFRDMDFDIPVRFSTEGFRPGGGEVEVNVPHLAEGGVVTKPTLAMIGEGNKAEGVFPLDRFFGAGGGGGGGTPSDAETKGLRDDLRQFMRMLPSELRAGFKHAIETTK